MSEHNRETAPRPPWRRATPVLYARRTGAIVSALADLEWTMRLAPITLRQAYQDIQQRYQRSVLGPLWLTLGTIAFIVGFVILGSIIFGVDRVSYISFLAAGIIAWQFTVALFVESAGMYESNSVALQAHRMPISVIPLRTFVRNLIILAHNIPVLLAIGIFSDAYNLNTLLIFPAIVIVFGSYLGLSVMLGMLGTRFRDIKPAMTVFMQFMFYFTPIFWDPAAIDRYPERLMIELNPFYYFITLLRAPLIGERADLLHWVVGGGLLLVSLGAAFVIFALFRRRLIYWL